MVDKQTRGAGIALTLGMLSGMHNRLHQLREGADEQDDRDIDSAQVFLEGAFDKLNEVLARQSTVPTPSPTISAPFDTESEED